jgi:hypothetical protein
MDIKTSQPETKESDLHLKCNASGAESTAQVIEHGFRLQ